MPRRQNSQHGGEGLAISIWHDQRSLDRRRYLAAEPGQQALPGALAQGHGLDGRLHHVLCPTEGKGQGNVAGCGCAQAGGQRKSDGKIIFPMPTGDAASAYDAVLLSRTGKLWSWTIQGFEPKAPYAGPQPFRPFGVGYVELPGQVIVESRLTSITGLRIGMDMELVIEDFDGERACFAFAPKESA